MWVRLPLSMPILTLESDDMTLNEAYKITGQMDGDDHRKPTKKQREAKWLIYREVISKEYKDKGQEVPPHMEPDYMEGWQ